MASPSATSASTSSPAAEPPGPPGALDGPRPAAAAAEHGTHLWAYDAGTIRAQIDRLSRFDVIHCAQKACSNLHILRLMREEGVHVDAVSEGESERALAAGYRVDGAETRLIRRRQTAANSWPRSSDPRPGPEPEPEPGREPGAGQVP
ncbi:hypothetical protein ABS735_03025 [Streptomyces sp. MMCC 100]|uniref:hypothetical protein n=1 Tax=Streptomyces sp. MMCC 100 TaxID=3163555 RepID=UPI003599CD66